MNTAQMRYFVTVAQMENMSRAAELLHLSQPSLSKSISKLEEDLGMELFIRSGRRIALNEAGRRFLVSAMAVLQELYDAKEEMEEMAGGRGNRLSVGIYGAHPALLPCLSKFARLHPEVEYNLTCNIEAIEHLDIADFDMLVYPDLPKYEKFVGMRLYDERYLLALPVRHPLVAKAAVLPKDFLEEPMVFLRSGNYTELCHTLCVAMNPALQIRGYVSSPEIHREMVASGMGLGFVPEGCAEAYRRDPGIRLRPITNDKFSRVMMVCFKKEKYTSPLGRMLREFMAGCLDGAEQEKKSPTQKTGGQGAVIKTDR